MKEMSDKLFAETDTLYDKIFINTAELAALLGVSRAWVEARRNNIIGSQQFNGRGRWFFDPQAIRRAVALGESILLKEDKK